MSIEAMKQALEALEELHRTGDTQVFDMCYAPKVIPALRQAIDAYTLSSRPPGLCMCGEPWRLESVHRKKSPCFDYIEREWVGLTDEDRADLWEQNRASQTSHDDYACAIEQALKEKNT
jgi:hypothetical protein